MVRGRVFPMERQRNRHHLTKRWSLPSDFVYACAESHTFASSGWVADLALVRCRENLTISELLMR
jgi:hypothetical protein